MVGLDFYDTDNKWEKVVQLAMCISGSGIICSTPGQYEGAAGAFIRWSSCTLMKSDQPEDVTVEQRS